MTTTTQVSTTGCKSEPDTREQIERLIRAAHVLLDHAGYAMGARRVNALVHRFVEQVGPRGWTFFDFMANAIQLDAEARRSLALDPDVARAISYADPTGEHAVNVVLSERGF